MWTNRERPRALTSTAKQGSVADRIAARAGLEAALVAPVVDEAEVDRLFRIYAPGRRYFTEYDFARMREGEHARGDAAGGGDGLGGALKRWSRRRRRARLHHAFADLVVEEDRKLVPAISHDMLCRAYQGTTQDELDRERRDGRS